MASVAPERIFMRGRFEEICGTNSSWAQLDKEQRDALVRRMERNCFEVTIASCMRDGIDRIFIDKRFLDRYSATCGRVLANLDATVLGHFKGDGNTIAMTKLCEGTLDPYHIAELSSEELCPDASAAERRLIEIRQTQKAAAKVSRAHTCRKCGGNETIKVEYQGRSADELSNFSIKCVNCEYVWRT